MKHTITLKLSVNGVNDAIRQIKEYQSDTQERTKLLAEKLADIGKDEAKLLVPVMTSALKESIDTTIVEEDSNGATYAVVANSGYAKFVEFGTGIKGENNPHELAEQFGWEYDVNSHGEAGWWYPSSESDPNPHKRIGNDGKTYAWTKGMPSRPFMYETIQDLQDKVVDVAKEIFG